MFVNACGFVSSAETTTTTTTSTTTTTTLPAILSKFSMTIPGLSVEDCFNNGEPATQIECSELHDGQVIATDVLLDYTLSGSDSQTLWEADAEDKCADEYESFVGHEYNRTEGRFRISILLTDASSTRVTCTVINADGEKWAGSAKNFVGSYEGVSVGDCFMFPTAINDAVVVSCTVPHDGEMFLRGKSTGITAKDAPYPTRSEWRDIAYRICDKPYYAYTGVSEDDETLSYSFTYPLEEDWVNLSRRTISCIATSYTGERLSYSVRR